MKKWATVLITAFIWCSCVAPRKPAEVFVARDFPVIPPIVDVDPSVRHVVLALLPNRLILERSPEGLSVGIDQNSLDSYGLLVGSNMVTGVETAVFLYPVGEARPARCAGYGLSGDGFAVGGTQFFSTKRDGVPVLGKKYIVEMEINAFESDTAVQHYLDPHTAKFKVIWTRTLKATVE